MDAYDLLSDGEQRAKRRRLRRAHGDSEKPRIGPNLPHRRKREPQRAPRELQKVHNYLWSLSEPTVSRFYLPGESRQTSTAFASGLIRAINAVQRQAGRGNSKAMPAGDVMLALAEKVSQREFGRSYAFEGHGDGTYDLSLAERSPLTRESCRATVLDAFRRGVALEFRYFTGSDRWSDRPVAAHRARRVLVTSVHDSWFRGLDYGGHRSFRFDLASSLTSERETLLPLEPPQVVSIGVAWAERSRVALSIDPMGEEPGLRMTRTTGRVWKFHYDSEAENS